MRESLDLTFPGNLDFIRYGKNGSYSLSADCLHEILDLKFSGNLDLSPFPKIFCEKD